MCNAFEGHGQRLADVGPGGEPWDDLGAISMRSIARDKKVPTTDETSGGDLLPCTPSRIRTGAAAVRGRCPRPLNDGGNRSADNSRSAGVPGLEPRITEPESVVLPITPYPKGLHLEPLAVEAAGSNLHVDHSPTKSLKRDYRHTSNTRSIPFRRALV